MPAFAGMSGLSLLRQLAHHLNQVGLAFEADAGKLRHRDEAVLDTHAVGEAAVGLEQVRVALVASEPEASCDVERHLMAAVRDAAAPRPTALLEHIERAQVLDEPIRERAIELQPIAVRPHPAI